MDSFIRTFPLNLPNLIIGLEVQMLSKTDISEIIALLRLLEEVTDQRSFFSLFSKGMERLVNISTAVYIPYDCRIQALRTEGHYVYEASSSLLMEYAAHFHPMDPFVSSGWFFRNDSRVALYEDFVPMSTLENSEFMVDFLQRVPMKYCLAMRFVTQGDFMGTFGLHRVREYGPFTERERQIADIMCDHLSQIFHRWEFMSGENLFSDPEIGLLIADLSGTVLYSNSMARLALEETFPASLLSLAKGTQPIYLRSRGCIYRIRSFPMTANSTLFLENRIAGKAWGKVGNGIVVLLFEPVTTSRSIRQKLEAGPLTPRQRMVVEKVLQGLTNREIAQEFGLSEQTVKDHLHNIFEKLRIRNRMELTVHFSNPPEEIPWGSGQSLSTSGAATQGG